MRARLEGAALAVGVFLAAMGIFGAARPGGRTVEAARFVVRGPGGKVQASISGGKGGPVFELTGGGRALAVMPGGILVKGPAGKTGIALSAGKDGGGFDLFDAGGRRRFSVGVVAEGVVLGVLDAKGKTRASLIVADAEGRGVQSLTLFDGAGRRVWRSGD